MNRVIKALIITASALFEVSAYSQQLTIMQLKDALKHQYTPQAVQATGYVLGAYDAMTGIVHCPTGMTPTRDTLIKWTQEGLERYHGPNRGADHLLAAVFAQRAPCAKKGLT
jgi:hypothetical protein